MNNKVPTSYKYLVYFKHQKVSKYGKKKNKRQILAKKPRYKMYLFIRYCKHGSLQISNIMIIGKISTLILQSAINISNTQVIALKYTL